MNLGPSCGLSQEQTQRQSQHLSRNQSLELKHLLDIEQRLVSPAPPFCLRGIEGIRKADEILKARNLSGLLIGGVASAVWSMRGHPKDISARKDVDVAVAGYNCEVNEVAERFEDFEGGIDWWIPRKAKVNIKSIAGNFDKELAWFQNGNGVALRYSFKSFSPEKWGLYIPSVLLIVSYLENQLRASISGAGVDEEVFEKFKEKRKASLGTYLSPLVKDYPVCGEHEVEFATFEHRDVVAINDYKTSQA